MNKYLKLFMLFLVAALPLTFASCGSDDKDDDEEIEIVTPIVGTWNGTIKDEDITLMVSYTFRSNGLFTARFDRETSIMDDDNSVVVNGSYTYNQGQKLLSMQGHYDGGKNYSLTARCEISGTTMTWTTSDGETITLRK